MHNVGLGACLCFFQYANPPRPQKTPKNKQKTKRVDLQHKAVDSYCGQIHFICFSRLTRIAVG